MSRCRYCDTEITWLKEGRKNVPVESDGTQHQCEQFKKMRSSIRTIDPKDLDPEILKQYQDNLKNLKKKKK